MIRTWGQALLLGWSGIVVITGLVGLCGLVVFLAIAGNSR